MSREPSPFRALGALAARPAMAWRRASRPVVLCVLPLALVSLLPLAGGKAPQAATAEPSSPTEQSAPSDCEQARKAYRTCLAAEPSIAPESEACPGAVGADGNILEPKPDSARRDRRDPRCDELRQVARRRLVSLNCRV